MVGLTPFDTYDKIESPEPWVAPRCVLIIDQDLFVVGSSRLWVDSLHIQIHKQLEESQDRIEPLRSKRVGQLFMTNNVVQGDALAHGVAAYGFRSRSGMYAEGVLKLGNPGTCVTPLAQKTNSSSTKVSLWQCRPQPVMQHL